MTDDGNAGQKGGEEGGERKREARTQEKRRSGLHRKGKQYFGSQVKMGGGKGGGVKGSHPLSRAAKRWRLERMQNFKATSGEPLNLVWYW